MMSTLHRLLARVRALFTDHAGERSRVRRRHAEQRIPHHRPRRDGDGRAYLPARRASRLDPTRTLRGDD